MNCDAPTPAAASTHNIESSSHLPSATQLINGSTDGNSGDGTVEMKRDAGLGAAVTPLSTLQSFLVGYAAAINKSKAGKGKRKSLLAPVTVQPPPISPATPRPDVLPTETSRVMAARKQRRKLLQMERMVMLVDRRDVPSAHEVLPIPRPSAPEPVKSSPPSDIAAARNGAATHVGSSGLATDNAARPVFVTYSPMLPTPSHSPVFTSGDRSRYRSVKTRSSGESVSAHLDRLVRPAILTCLAGPPVTLPDLRSAVEKELQAAVPTTQRSSTDVSTAVASAMTGFNLWFHRLIEEGLVSRVQSDATAVVVSASSVTQDTLLTLCGWDGDVGDGTAWLRASNAAAKERRTQHSAHAAVSDDVWCPLARLHASAHTSFHGTSVSPGVNGVFGGVNSTAARLARISQGGMVADVCASAEYVTQCIRHPPELVTHPMSWPECVENFTVLTEEQGSPEHPPVESSPANGLTTASGAHIPPLDVDKSGTFETPMRIRVPQFPGSDDRNGTATGTPAAARMLASVVSPLPKSREKSDVLVRGFKVVDPADVLHVVEDKPVFVLPGHEVPTSLPLPQPPVVPNDAPTASPQLPPSASPVVTAGTPLSSEAPTDANDLLFTSPPSAAHAVAVRPSYAPVRSPSPPLPEYWVGFGQFERGQWHRPVSCWDKFQKPTPSASQKPGKIGFARGRPFVKGDKSHKAAKSPGVVLVQAAAPSSEGGDGDCATPTSVKPPKPAKSTKKRKTEAKLRQQQLKSKKIEDQGEGDDVDDPMKVQASDGEDTSDEAYARRHVRMNIILRRRMAHAQKRVERAASLLKARKPPKSREGQQAAHTKANSAMLSLQHGDGCDGERQPGNRAVSESAGPHEESVPQDTGQHAPQDTAKYDGSESGDEGSASGSKSDGSDSDSDKDVSGFPPTREVEDGSSEEDEGNGGADGAGLAGGHGTRGRSDSSSDSGSERRGSGADDDVSDLNDDDDDVDELRRQLGLAPALPQPSAGWLRPSSDSGSPESDMSDDGSDSEDDETGL